MTKSFLTASMLSASMWALTYGAPAQLMPPKPFCQGAIDLAKQSMALAHDLCVGENQPPIWTPPGGGGETPPGGGGGNPAAVLPPYNDASANWKIAGLTLIGGIPSRTAQCGPTLRPSGSDDLAQITAAIAACPANQVLQLGEGKFIIPPDGYVLLNKPITLRGAGGGKTIISVRDGTIPTYVPGGQCGEGATVKPCGNSPAIIISAQGRWTDRWTCNLSQDCTGKGIPLTADVTKGDTTIQVQDASGLAQGMWVRIDELSGAQTQPNPSNPSKTVFAAPDFTSPSGEPATGRVAYAGSGVEDGAGYGALLDRPTSEIHLISAVSGNSVTFDSPLTIAFRVGHKAQIYKPNNAPFLEKAGLENLTVERATNGIIYMGMCAYCWIKGVETNMWSGGVTLSNVARVEVTDSYLHDTSDPENNGAEYPIAIDGGTTESLVDNNIIVLGGKGMVGRSCGGGNVVSYNYVDRTFYMPKVIGNYWLDMGVNGSHYVGCHHMLFEGNWGSNCDNDNTHGNTVYGTYFRNWCTGLRTDFSDPGFWRTTSSTYNPAQAPVSDINGIGYATYNPYPYPPGPLRPVGMMEHNYWFAYVGNVLGELGVTDTEHGWQYQQSGLNSKRIWMMGWIGGGGGNDFDHNLDVANPHSYFFRHGNYDYFNRAIVDWHADYSQALPDSLYVANKPIYFAGAHCQYAWPWITPTGSDPIQTPTGCVSSDGLPAKARFDAGTPFAQP